MDLAILCAALIQTAACVLCMVLGYRMICSSTGLMRPVCVL